MDIDTIPAGREMDVRVAEALRWTPCFGEGHETHMMSAVGAPPYYHHDNSIAIGLPHFSTDIKDAWGLAEKFRMTITPNVAHPKSRWCVDVQLKNKNDLWLVGAETAPLAICRATLKIVMGDGNGH